MTHHLLLRIHSDLQLGLGHVARALAIAEAWQALGGSATLAISGDAKAERVGGGLHPWKEERLPLEAVYLGSDIAAPVPEALSSRATISLLDLWFPTADHVANLRPSKVAIFEDEGDAHESADLLLQPYLEGVNWPSAPVKVVDGRKVKPYETRRGTCRVLRGAQYIVVGQSVRGLRPKREPLQPLAVHKLLVTFGGTDGPGLASYALAVLRDLVARGAYLGTCTLVAPNGVSGGAIPGCTVVPALPDLTRRMLDYDAIWCAAGVTLADAICLGVPAAAWGQNERQQAMIADLGQANGCLNLGLGTEADLSHTSDALERWLGPEGQDSRQEQTRDGMALVDGGGALRIAQELWNLAKA